MINAAVTLFRVFFNICTFRNKPQDLPLSSALLALTLFCYTLANILLMMSSAPVTHAVLAGLLETGLVSLITICILKLSRHAGRWTKTLMALAGTGCIMSLLALPLFSGGLLQNAGGALQALLLMIYLVLLIWNIMVMAHILRHAMDTSLGVGIVFAIIYIVISTVLINTLLPAMVAG